MNMADNAADSNDDTVELRNTLLRRLAMAGVLVAILLGVLAFFDHLSSVPEESETPVFTAPVPVAPPKEVSQPVTPAENRPEAPPDAAAATAEAPPPPVVEAKPTAEAGSTAQSAPAGHRPATASATPPSPVAEATAPPQPLAPPATPASAPVKPPAAPRLSPGFVLQAGVFSNPQLAEELHAKLTLNGVPSSIETRVQVGPFRTRQEAEAAQARLKEQGIQTILIAPAGRR